MKMSSRLKPSIKLEEGETLELAIRRSPILLIMVVAGELIATAFFIAFLIYYKNPPAALQQPSFAYDYLNHQAMFLIICVLYVTLLIVGLVKIHLHRKNILFVTNRRIIQQSVPSLLSNSLNVIDLVSTEDVSFHQAGIFDHIFQLGNLRISTVGDETTYIFNKVDTPTNEVEYISNLISQSKARHRRKHVVEETVIVEGESSPQQPVVAEEPVSTAS